MKPKPLAFKVAALSCSLLFAGSYVWYRSGGSLPFISNPVAAETPEPHRPPPPRAEDHSPHSSEEIVREILLSGSKSEAIVLPPKPARKLLPGSKSSEVEFENSPAPPKPARKLLPGSKSSGFDFENSPVSATPKGAPQRKPEPAASEHTIIVPYFEFEDAAPPKSDPKSAPQQQQAPAQPRALMPSSKVLIGIVEFKEPADESKPKSDDSHGHR